MENLGGISNYRNAIFLYKKADTKGYSNAQSNIVSLEERIDTIVEATVNLGVMHEKGIGTSRNMDKAMQYYVRAAQYGASEAQNKINNLKKKIKKIIRTLAQFGNIRENELNTAKKLTRALKLYRACV